MSQMTATARVGVRTPARRATPTPTLRVVTGEQTRRTGAAFAILCVALLVSGLLAMLLLNTGLAQGSYTLYHLQSRAGELSDTEDAITQELQTQESPAHLAARAAALGMVPSQSAAFLRLSDGKTLGVATAAARQPGFAVVAKPGPVGASRTTAAPGMSTPAGPAGAAPSTAADRARHTAHARAAAHRKHATR